MRRFASGLLLLTLMLALAPSARAGKLEDAKEKARKIRAELDAATRELETIERDQDRLQSYLKFGERQLAEAKKRVDEARKRLGREAVVMYRSGGLSLAGMLLEQDAGQVPDKIQMVSVLVSRQAESVADAEIAAQSYNTTLERVEESRKKLKDLRKRADAAVGKLAERFQDAKALVDELDPRPPIYEFSGREYACPVAVPYSYIDSWGYARSGGRAHKGTDIMAPYRTKIYSYTAGVITRLSYNSLGGNTIYLQGDNGVEYYYAHLSGYSANVYTGKRVTAGTLMGYVGKTGNARFTSPHLHFEVHPGGVAVNPYPYVARTCP